MSKMLIVDDEEKIRAVVREYAEFEDFEVTEARDGMERLHSAGKTTMISLSWT